MSTGKVSGAALSPDDLEGLAVMAGEIQKLANGLFASPDLSAALQAPERGAAPATPVAGLSDHGPRGPDHLAGAADPPAVTPGVTAAAPLLAVSPLLPVQAGPEPVNVAPASPATWSSSVPDLESAAGPQAIPGLGADLSSAAGARAVPSLASWGRAAPGVEGAPIAPEALPGAPSDAPYFLDLVRPRPEPGASAVPAESLARVVGGIPYEIHPELVPAVASPPSLIDPHAVRRDFPILQERVRGKRLVWLDNGATTHKPRAVIDRISYFYEHENSNVHRGAHTLAARATDAYEGARDKVRRFLNAPSASEIVLVRGATEGINLVAQSWGRRNVGAGDEIVITHLEHHANIVPWQQLCAEKGAKLKVAPVDSTGQVLLEEYERLLGPRTRMVALSQVSNALGTIVPAREMIEMAHRHGARVLLDGAQAVSHLPVDVQVLGCDFYVFSGHKVFAPTGIGAVFGKREVLDAMPPWQGGGNMIADVTFEKTVYQAAPMRFEAGTGSIADAVGLGAALDYVESLGRANIDRYEHDLRVYAEGCLSAIPGLRIIGTARDKAGVISFVLQGVRTEEVGGILDQDGIAVRSGHHCAQPILRRFGLEATVRASLAPYNTREDIEALAASVRRIQLGRAPHRG